MSEFITPSVADDAPPPRNLSKELDAIYGAEAKYAPQSAQLAQTYDPVYNRVSISNLGESVLGYTDGVGNHVPGSVDLTTGANTAQRASDLADVQKMGPEATAAYLAANPDLAASRSTLLGRTTDSPLLSQLNSQAAAGLAANGALDPETQRSVDQQTRQAYADRGMFGSNSAIGAEILNRENARQARIQSAQQFALGVQPLNTAQSGVVNAATGTLASTLADPYSAILGRTSGAVGQQNNSSAYSPMNLGSYAQDLFNTNYNAGVNLAIQQSNAEANTRSSIATVASSFSDERLKENVVGVDKTKDGIPIVEFTYRDIPAVPEHLRGKRYRGVIAQQAQLFRPDAIMRGRDGYLRVRYDKLGVKLELLPNELKEAA